MNIDPILLKAISAGARAFADVLDGKPQPQHDFSDKPAPAPAATPKTTKAAPAAKVETPAPEPVKEPEPEVSFDEPAEITLDSLKAKFKPLVQHADADKRKSFQGVVGKWLLDHGAKAISEVKAEDYTEFDAFLTKTSKDA